MIDPERDVLEQALLWSAGEPQRSECRYKSLDDMRAAMTEVLKAPLLLGIDFSSDYIVEKQNAGIAIGIGLALAVVKRRLNSPPECSQLGHTDPETGMRECALDVRGKDCPCNNAQELLESLVEKIKELKPEPVGAAGWQPIDTAPKDGSRFLLLNSENLVCEGYWLDNSKSPYPFQGIRPRPMWPERPGVKWVGWQPFPAVPTGGTA